MEKSKFVLTLQQTVKTAIEPSLLEYQLLGEREVILTLTRVGSVDRWVVRLQPGVIRFWKAPGWITVCDGTWEWCQTFVEEAGVAGLVKMAPIQRQGERPLS